MRPRLLLLGLAVSSLHCSQPPATDAGDAASPTDADDATDIVTDIQTPRCPDMPALQAGTADGHAAPLASTATESRAGRLTASQLPADRYGLTFARAGDYVLANDHLAVVVASARDVDGYMPWGGKIVALARVSGGALVDAADFNEATFAAGRYILQAESVTVTNDGSNGQPATVRAIGVLRPIPFLDEFARGLAPLNFSDFRIALDYELRAGSDSVDVSATIDSRRVGAAQIRPVMHGFFQGDRMHRYGPTPQAFATAFDAAPVPYVAYIDDRAMSFAWSSPSSPLTFLISESGFDAFSAAPIDVPPCAQTRAPVVHLTAGGPGLDGLLQSIARAENRSLREIHGVVHDANGMPAAAVHLHATSADGATYLTRVESAADGTYSLHVPAGQAVQLTAWRAGDHKVGPIDIAATQDTADVSLMPAGSIHVVATEEGSGRALPVRVQVIPEDDSLLANLAGSFGEQTPRYGRLHTVFPTTGDITLPAPVGNYRVVVSRGYEYELSDTSVTVTANNTSMVAASLRRSVESPNVQCGDFHIHTRRSPDAPDDARYKLSALIGDGLEIPVRSDHEFVGDFADLLRELNLESWAYPVPSIELTTFTYGHFGVVPFPRDPAARNGGSPPWANLTPPQVFAAVRANPAQPTIIINHPSRGRVISAYFRFAGYDPATGVAAHPDMWDETFTAVEVFNASDFQANRDASVADWFGLLQHGRRVFSVGSSDSHSLAGEPVGYPRTCMQLGTDDPRMLSNNQIRDAVAQGHSVINGGVFMTARTASGAGPGDSVSGAGASATVHVTAQAPTWVPVSRLEVFVDGASVQTLPLDASTRDPSNPVIRFDRDITVPIASGGSWVIFVVHSDGNLSPVHPGYHPFGVTNPIFFSR
jgi:hypothetical protein